jgi:hypothetical protein
MPAGGLSTDGGQEAADNASPNVAVAKKRSPKPRAADDDVPGIRDTRNPSASIYF